LIQIFFLHQRLIYAIAYCGVSVSISKGIYIDFVDSRWWLKGERNGELEGV